jgi:hypothetical protein
MQYLLIASCHRIHVLIVMKGGEDRNEALYEKTSIIHHADIVMLVCSNGLFLEQQELVRGCLLIIIIFRHSLFISCDKNEED